MAAPVVGLLLAAGESRRLPGRPKQLLNLGGQPLIQYGIDLLRTAEMIDIVIVALGKNAEAIESQVDLARCQVVKNQSPGDGCAGSITAAMKWIRENIANPRGLVLAPGDQPLLSDVALSAVAEAVLAKSGPIESGMARPDIAVARYDDGVGHPFAFRPSTFDRLEAAGGDKAAWKLVNDAGFEVHEVRVDGPVPRDIDTWSDYHQLRQHLALR